MKRILSLFLVLIMLLGMLPTASYALEAEDVTAEEDATVEGTDSLGTLVSDAIDQEQANDGGYSGGYGISGVELDGNDAFVTYQALGEATLLVGIYSEDGYQLLCSGKTTVTEDATEAIVCIEGELPAYFEVTAYLLDTQDFTPLCAAFSTSLYTQAIQDLLASTVEDYDPDSVLNLDDDETTNFAVYNDGITVISGDESINIVASADYDNSCFTFQNADEQLTGLTTDDIFVYPYAEDCIIIVKVDTIEVDGQTVTVTGAQLELSEVFAYMKLETSADSSSMQYAPEDCDDGVTYEGVQEVKAVRAWEDDLTLSQSLKFSLQKEWPVDDTGYAASVEGSATLGVSAKLSYYIALDKQVIELKVTSSISYAVTLAGSLTVDSGIKLGKVVLPSPIYGITFECTPQIIWRFSIEATISGTVSRVTGFRYDSGSGFHDISQKAKTTYDASIEGKLFVGLKMESGVGIINPNIAQIGFTVRMGVEVTCKLLGSMHEDIADNAYRKHICEECLSIQFDFVAEFSVWLTMLKYIKVENTFLAIRVPLGEMYVSEPYGTGSGACPYYEYRVTVQVRDSEKSPVEAQKVYLSTGEDLGKTSKYGSLSVYLPKGTYTFETNLNGETVSVTRDIDNSTKIVLTNNKELLQQIKNYTKLLISSLSVTGEDIIAQGSFASGVTWKLYRSGKFIVSGTGSMDSYASASATPWYTLSSRIKAVELRDGVTSVGAYAFAGCTNMTTLIIADSVGSKFGTNAFYGCTGLTSVRLPVDYTVHTYDYWGGNYCGAFQGCVNVEKIHYTYGSTGIMTNRNATTSSGNLYSYSLEYLSRNSLKTVIFDEGITTVGNYAFYSGNALAQVYLPESMTSIGSYAFSNNKLTAIEFPTSLLTIGTYAFAGSALTQLELTENITSIGSYAFSACLGLTELVIPDSLGSCIGSHAFNGCTSIKTVTLPVDYRVTAYYYAMSGSYTIYGSFTGCTNVETIYYTYGTTGQMSMRSKSQSNSTAYYLNALEYESKGALKQVYFDEGITVVGSYAFYYCSALSYVDLPSTLTTIGTYAFQSAGIEEIELPNGMTTIGAYAFSSSKLKSILFPDSLTSIAASAFEGCTGLTEIVIPDALGSVMGSYAFRNCTGLTKITLPVDYKVTTQYYWASGSNYNYGSFNGCTNVESIHYTPGTTGQMQSRTTSSTDQTAFYQSSLEYACGSSLKEVVFDEGITSIGNYAFYCNSALINVQLPSTLAAIGDYAFYNTSITGIDLPQGLLTIGNYAFYSTDLTAIDLPESITSIGTSAFEGCTGLTELVIPDALGSVMSSHTFRNCTGLTKVTLPVDYKVTTQYYWASGSNTNYGSFTGCTNVESIHYTLGTTGQMQSRTTSSSDETAYYKSSLEYACASSLKDVVFDEGITAIGQYAFYSCTALASVTFEGSMPSIFSNAFYSVTAEVYYPADDETWLEDSMLDYGGSLTWIAYNAPAGESSDAEEAAQQTAVKSAAKLATRAIITGTTASSETEDAVVLTTSFTDLVPNSAYLMIAVIDADAEDLLSSENLLALAQSAADEDGSLTFAYIQREQTDEFCVFVSGRPCLDIEDAEVEFPTMYAAEYTQVVDPTVSYNGTVLTEELDYIIVGEIDFTQPGTYTCAIEGVRSYTGSVEFTYTVEDPYAPENAVFTAASVVLDSALGVRFYTPLPNGSVTVAVGDSQAQEVYASDASAKAGQQEYTVSVFAQDMLLPITATLYASDGTVADVRTFYLTEYVSAIEQMPVSDETKTLAAALETYCQYAALLKGQYDGELNAVEAIPDDAFEDYAFPAAEGISGIRVHAYLEDACRIRMRLHGDYTDACVTVDGVEVAPITDDEYMLYASSPILPQHFSSLVNFTVETQGQTLYSGDFSVLAYLGTCIEQGIGSQEQLDLMTAMYHYWAAATAYLESKT